MGKSLVIVESPAKAKTINKYLGKDFVVKSSVGHVRDLPTKALGNVAPKKPAEELKELFINLVAIDSPSGFEEPMRKKLLDEFKPITDNVWVTPRGNIIGVQKGSDPKAPKIALVAHIDQIGFID